MKILVTSNDTCTMLERITGSTSEYPPAKVLYGGQAQRKLIVAVNDGQIIFSSLTEEEPKIDSSDH